MIVLDDSDIKKNIYDNAEKREQKTIRQEDELVNNSHP